jgi:hypothetical protein
MVCRGGAAGAFRGSGARSKPRLRTRLPTADFPMVDFQ